MASLVKWVEKAHGLVAEGDQARSAAAVAQSVVVHERGFDFEHTPSARLGA